MNNILIALTLNVKASIPDYMHAQYAADNLDITVNPGDEEITVTDVTVVSSAPVEDPSLKKIWCPHCGLHHVPTPVKYKVENEYETFQEELEEFECEGEGEDTVVTIPSCHIEAGPGNSDRYLVDYDVRYLECPGCNKSFAMDD